MSEVEIFSTKNILGSPKTTLVGLAIMVVSATLTYLQANKNTPETITLLSYLTNIGQAIVWALVGGSTFKSGNLQKLGIALLLFGLSLGSASAQTGRTYVNPFDIRFGTANQLLVTNAAGTGTIWANTGTLGILTSGTVAGGDLSGTLPSPTVSKIQGTAVSATVPTTGQILAYNGTAWTPTAAAVAQTISLATNTLTLSGGGGSVSLAPYLDNTDAQTLSFTAATNTLAITGGNSVVLGYGTYAATEQFYNPTGSTITLATTALPTDLAKIHVFRPFRVWHGTGNDWTISGQVITFTTAFAANERVVIDIFK